MHKLNTLFNPLKTKARNFGFQCLTTPVPLLPLHFCSYKYKFDGRQFCNFKEKEADTIATPIQSPKKIVLDENELVEKFIKGSGNGNELFGLLFLSKLNI
jgi:hypothetical protein